MDYNSNAEYNEKTLSEKHIFRGNIVKVSQLTVELPNGKQALRDIVRHPGASAVIPVNSAGEVYMVSQFRKPVEKTLLEIPAGKLDKGEDPEDCARRELLEETGLRCGRLVHLTSILTTPGFSDEILHIYAAFDLTEGDACTDEDEFLSCEKIPLKELVDMVVSGKISDSKTIIAILLAEKMLEKM